MKTTTHLVFGWNKDRPAFPPVRFGDLESGTWFTAKRHTGIEGCVWVKRNVKHLTTNAFSPHNGSSYHFKDGDEIQAVFDVNIQLVETR